MRMDLLDARGHSHLRRDPPGAERAGEIVAAEARVQLAMYGGVVWWCGGWGGEKREGGVRVGRMLLKIHSFSVKFTHPSCGVLAWGSTPPAAPAPAPPAPPVLCSLRCSAHAALKHGCVFFSCRWMCVCACCQERQPSVTQKNLLECYGHGMPFLFGSPASRKGSGCA